MYVCTYLHELFLGGSGVSSRFQVIDILLRSMQSIFGFQKGRLVKEGHPPANPTNQPSGFKPQQYSLVKSASFVKISVSVHYCCSCLYFLMSSIYGWKEEGVSFSILNCYILLLTDILLQYPNWYVVTHTYIQNI